MPGRRDAMAAAAEMVLAIDDLQFATDESISLLLRLAQGLNDAPVMFLATSRQTFGEQQSHFIEGMRAVGEPEYAARGEPDPSVRTWT